MLADRVKRLVSLIEGTAIQMFLITDNSDIYYYTSLELPKEERAFLIISDSGRHKLFLSPLFSQAEGLEGVDVHLFNKPEDIIENLSGFVGFDEKSLGADYYLKLAKKARMTPASELIKRPRMIKDAYEISQIKKGVKITRGILQDISLTGKKESEVSREIEARILESGYEKSFEIIVAGGPNSGFIHYRPGNRKIRKGDLVVVDIGVRFRNYCTDITRTFFFRAGKKAEGDYGGHQEHTS